MRLKNVLLIILSCILFVLGLYFPPTRFLSWCGFIPLFCIYLDEKTPALRAAGYAALAGLIYYANALQWLVLFHYGIYAALVAAASLFFGIYFFLLRWLTGKSKSILIHIGAAFFIWFILRTGLDYSPLSSTAADFPFYGAEAFYQLCSIQGFGLLSSLMMAVSAAVAAVFVRRSKTSIVMAVAILLALGSVFAWDIQQTKTPLAEPQESIRVALIQHNLPADGKWRFEHQETIQDTYKRLSRYAAASETDLIVFPLYSMPEDPLRNRLFFASLARRARKYILFASHVPKEPGGNILTDDYMNMAFLLSPDGSLWGPYQSSVSSPGPGMLRESTADQYQIIESPLGKIGILLCFESTHPRLTRQAVKQGADILISLSNPGRFTTPLLPQYHLIQNQLNAIETGRWVLQVSPNGYTAAIAPNGIVAEKTDLGQEQVLRFNVSKTAGANFYQRYPFILMIAAYLFIVFLLIQKFSGQKRTEKNHRQESNQEPKK